MTDILKIALDRRAELHEEVARIDDFIRMADNLLRKLQPRDQQAEPSARELGMPREVHDAFREQPSSMQREIASGGAPGIARMNLMRRGPTAVSG